MKQPLLIVDDDEEIRIQMKWALKDDYEIVQANDRAEAVERFRANESRVVLLDLGLPPSPGSPDEGLKVLDDLLAIDHRTKIVIVSGQSEKEVALRAVGAGAYDILGKPVDMDELKQLLKRCYHVAGLEREYQEMREKLRGDDFVGIVGSSSSMQRVFTTIRKVATSDAPVLIFGESGTGKEMTARAIHQKSARKDGPFVAINCGAIPENLLESELFGHEKGAFTGAHVQRKGRFEHADGGTLFLDEIGEIPLALQVKLLRFLQEQCVERVGGREEIHVDTRIIAATNADLSEGMTAGTFREDLYYRLAVVQIDLPPLREREEDVELLARTFLKSYTAENQKPELSFDKNALRAIFRYSWPGNVRELQNKIRRAVIMADGRRLTEEDLGLTADSVLSKGFKLKDAREALERKMIREALQNNSGKIAPAAADLGISRPTFYDLMDRLGIERPE